jgi:hypothetical protein
MPPQASLRIAQITLSGGSFHGYSELRIAHRLGSITLTLSNGLESGLLRIALRFCRNAIVPELREFALRRADRRGSLRRPCTLMLMTANRPGASEGKIPMGSATGPHTTDGKSKWYYL